MVAVDSGLDAQDFDVGVSDSDRAAAATGSARGTTLGLVNGIYTDDGGTGAGDDAVGEVAVAGHEDVTGHLAHGDEFWYFLQLEELLVDEAGGLVDDHVRVLAARVGACFLRMVGHACTRQRHVTAREGSKAIETQGGDVATVAAHEC